MLGIAFCETLEEEPPANITWSFANGLVTIVFEGSDDEPWVFPVTRNGIFVVAGSSEFQAGHSWANLAMLVKVSN